MINQGNNLIGFTPKFKAKLPNSVSLPSLITNKLETNEDITFKPKQEHAKTKVNVKINNESVQPDMNTHQSRNKKILNLNDLREEHTN